LAEIGGYDRYSLELLQMRFGFLTMVDVWGADVRLGERTYYDGDSMRRKFGKKWKSECRILASKDRYEFRGYRPGDEIGVVLSWWATRLAKAAAEAADGIEPGIGSGPTAEQTTVQPPDSKMSGPAETAAEISAVMAGIRGAKKPAYGEIVFHLLIERRKPPAEVLKVLVELKKMEWHHLQADVEIADLERHAKNGRYRIDRDGKRCRLDGN
jgi:hypothetical protein